MPPPATYAELQCRSNYSFLTAASHPEELVRRAHELGYSALALTDECSLAGVVRAHCEAKACGLKLLIGTELVLDKGTRLVIIATDRQGYGNLSHLISTARRRSPKGRYRVEAADLASGCTGWQAIWCIGAGASEDDGHRLKSCFGSRLSIGVALHRSGGDHARLERASTLAKRCRLAQVAVGGVSMHVKERQRILDTLTAIRLGKPLAASGDALHQNGECHLRSRDELMRFYPAELLAETVRIADACQFSLDELRYEYPDELVPPGITASTHLRRLVMEGAAMRWPAGVPTKVERLLEHELALIDELRYQHYFVTVYDIVRFARSRGILCQGRGSAANSAVCYCLFITEVDPARIDLLFERFISKERGEPPDIDVDFEHRRREEVIQYIYDKYGRDRAALAATVITYRTRSAVRDVGRALGLAADQIERLRRLDRWDEHALTSERVREIGLDPNHSPLRETLELIEVLRGFPRHLSQHVGGFVIARDALTRLVPIENAAMDGRTVIQWDKDDIDALGLLKVDCLALGMLSAIRRALDLISGYRGLPIALVDIPPEDPDVYAMIQRAETMGVFQIESRAQMAMLPRLKPACFYDLVIEVAIVRPGPIQGDMVHPYLRRRSGAEPIDYPSPEVESVLGRTLGVPIFQEQVIKIAMVAAGFSPGEADQVRRSMAAWRRRGGIEAFRDRLLTGMIKRGYPEAYAEQIYRQILGFGEYGFPESHAASFALLVYVSAWLKHHQPAAFFAALLDSQPMGFYAPAQLVREARRQGVEVRPVDVAASGWDCSLETDRMNGTGPALRLGLRLIKGLSRGGAERLLAQRTRAPWHSVADLARRAELDRKDLSALAAANALAGLGGHRHQAAWQVTGIQAELPLAPATTGPIPALPPPSEAAEVVADYASLGLSLRPHPLAFLRERLRACRLITIAEVADFAAGNKIQTSGLVIARQRPAAAKQVTFITLEDETGYLNLIVWRRIGERQRATLIGASLLGAFGEIQRESGVTHLVVETLYDFSHLLAGLTTRSRGSP